MIAISKEEKDVISKRFPNVHIVRTMRQKSKRHHYFCEESRGVMNYLKEARNINSPKGGGNNKHRAK
jgi:hypothetical protein